jgi:hypothetical protein
MFARMLNRSPAPRTARHTKQYFTVEGLEGRQLMSLGAEFGISVATPVAQVESANASSANGSSVVVWTESTPSTPQIMGQLFNAQDVEVGEHVVIRGSGNGLF